MHPQFGMQHLMVLLGGAVMALIVVLLAVYLLHKSLSRTLTTGKSGTPNVRFQDETAFTLTTLKAVVTQLKADLTAIQEKLIEAERSAEQSHRRFELVAREFEHGLMIFDAQGFITFSNPITRKILGVDTWSRRRYAEIFSELPALSELIGKAVHAGTEDRNSLFEFQGSDGNKRRIEVSVLPSRDRTGAMESVVCIFRFTPPTMDA
jgi:PAS domain-containing protein